jgi:hypothetical protein
VNDIVKLLESIREPSPELIKVGLVAAQTTPEREGENIALLRAWRAMIDKLIAEAH